MRRILNIAILVLTSNCVYGQKNIINQDLIWYGLVTTFNIHEKWYFQNEIHERHFVGPLAQHQFFIRSHMHRFLGNSGWEVSMGMGLFFQNPGDPHSSIRLTVPELRPHIEFAYRQKLDNVILGHRYRVDARFFHNTNSTRTELEDGFDFGNFRFRYRLQATIPLFSLSDNRSFKLKISDEIQLNAGNKISINVFDQNRIYGGISYDILQNLTFDIGYLHLFQQRTTGDFYNRNILRFTVSHRVNLRKNKA